MALTKYAAPKPQRVKLPMVQVPFGSGNILEPKPVAANFYVAPASTGLPAPVTPRPTTPAATFDPSTVQSSGAAANPTVSDVDYKALLASDPLLSQQLDAIAAQQTANLQTTTDLQNRAYIQYGDFPTFRTAESGTPTSSLIGDTNIDALTRQLAQEANLGGVSTMSIRDKSLADSRSSYLASLASRNMIQSGEIGQHENEVTAAWAQGTYQDRQALADYLISLWQDHLGSLSEGNSAKATATMEALKRIIDQVAQQEALRQAKAAADKAAADKAAADEYARTHPYADLGINPLTGKPYGTTYEDLGVTPSPITRAMVDPPLPLNTTTVKAPAGITPKNPFPQDFTQLDTSYQMVPIPGMPGGMQSNFTPAEIAAINQSPNILRTIGSDAAQIQQPQPGPYSQTIALQSIPSDAGAGGWSDPVRTAQAAYTPPPPDPYVWGQTDQPLYEPYYNPDPVIPQMDYSQVDPNLLAIGDYGGYKRAMYD